MRAVIPLALAGYLLSLAIPLLRPVFGTAAVILFPGAALLAAIGFRRSSLRDLLWGPALSPFLVGLAGIGGFRFAGVPDPWVRVLLIGSGFFLAVEGFLRRPAHEGDEGPTRGDWIAVCCFLSVAAAILLPRDAWRLGSDAWFHTAVAREVERAGIPPQDPYFAGLTLQYFWFYHAVLVSLAGPTGLDPGGAMALLNLLSVALIVPAASMIMQRLGFDRVSRTWAGVIFLLGMGGLIVLFFPVKFATLFLGEVRGAAAWGDLVHLHPYTTENAYRFLTILQSQDFMLKKFLVGTAASQALLLDLLVLAQTLHFVGSKATWKGGVLLVVTGCAAFTFHSLLGGATLAALLLAVAWTALTRWTPRVRTLTALVLLVAAVVAVLPYLASVTRGKETESLIPVGINLLQWLSLPFSLAGATALALPGIRRLWSRRRGPAGLFLAWGAASVGYGILGRLPGANQYDKTTIVAFVPLALLAGAGVPGLWRRWAGTRRKLFAAFLVIYLVPENAMLLAAFAVEDPIPAPTPSEVAFEAWSGKNTPSSAIFIDTPERLDLLVRGPRRLYFGREAYAEQWGYPKEEMARRWELVKRLLGVGGGGRIAGLEALDTLDGDVYVVVRDRDRSSGVPAAVESPGEPFDRVYDHDGIRVYRYRRRSSKMHSRLTPPGTEP